MHDIRIPDHIIRRVLDRRGKLHIYDRLDGGSTALLVVDLQNIFMLPGMPLEVPSAREIVPNVNRLAAAVRTAGGLVVWVQLTGEGMLDWSSYHERLSPNLREAVAKNIARGADGHALHADLDVQADDLLVEKTRYSLFIQGASEIDAELRRRRIDTVIVVGTLTNVCCESTARDAMMLNYRTILVSDANAALSDEEHNMSLANVLTTFGDVLSTDEVLTALIAEAGAVPGHNTVS
ncbi:MAG TPA: cysteine hydrolase [Acidimicrobiia bacterium]|jgi:ureidoacrylate peracid hydrolase